MSQEVEYYLVITKNFKIQIPQIYDEAVYIINILIYSFSLYNFYYILVYGN